jgi:hypothetical protein
MIKRIIINKGKKYIVNCVGGVDEQGIGAGCPSGVAWLSDNTGSWFSVQLTGTSGSLSLSTTAIPATSQSVGMNANDFPFQIVQANDGLNYQVSIVAGSVVISQTPSAYNSSKPYLFLQSKTDSAYYYVSAKNTAGTITLVINDNTRMDGSLVQPLN